MLEFFIGLMMGAATVMFCLELYQRATAKDYSKYGSKFTVVKAKAPVKNKPEDRLKSYRNYKNYNKN